MGKQSEREARTARVEAIRIQQERRERRRSWTLVGITAAVIVLLAGGAIWVVLGSRTPKVALTGLQTYPNLARDHTQHRATSAQSPPVGGNHAATWQNCGIYTSPVGNEYAAHSLEHGAMWITYRPDLPADQVKILQDDLRGQPYGLLSPYPGLSSPVVATIWGTQLKLSSATDPRLKTFISTYADGSHAPEPKGECTGGTGTPQG